MADQNGVLVRRARLLTEEGRVRERLRLAEVLRGRIASAGKGRLALHPVMPEAFWPARAALLRAEMTLREAEAGEPVARPAPARPAKPRIIARLRRRLSARSAGAEPASVDPAPENAVLREARRDRDAARHRLSAIRSAHERAVAATRVGRTVRLARLDRRIVRAKTALELLGADEAWTIRGLRALLREARREPPHLDIHAAQDHDGDDPNDGPTGLTPP